MATRRQQTGESLDEYLRELRKLGKDCNLKSVTAEQYREELIRDAFINGLVSPLIRQRLLENKSLDLESAYNQAYSLDLAHRNAEAYTSQSHTAAVVASEQPVACLQKLYPANSNPINVEIPQEHAVAAAYGTRKRCFFCGRQFPHKFKCPARDVN